MSGPEDRAPFVIDFGEAFQRYIDSKKKVWKHDRSTTAGASEVFNCLRQLWYEKRHKEFGIEPDASYEQSWGATHRGDMIENYYVVPALTQELPHIGLALEFAGDDQETLVSGRNSSTPDGLICDIPVGPVTIRSGDVEIFIPWVDTGCIGLEVKSIDPRATLEEERAKHRGQSQVGLGIIRETTQWRPMYWVILYVDASFVDKLTPFVVEYDPAIYEAAKKRAATVWATDDPMALVPEGKFDKGCDYCKWRDACTASILSAYAQTNDKFDAFDVEEFEPVVAEFFALKDAAEAAEAAFKKCQQTVKDKLLDRKLRKITSETWNVTWSSVKGHNSLDREAAIADGVDLSKYEKRGANTERLLITPRKKKGAPVRE